MVSFTSSPLYPGTHWVGNWKGHRTGLDALEERTAPYPCCKSNPDLPHRSLVTIPTELSRPLDVTNLNRSCLLSFFFFCVTYWTNSVEQLIVAALLKKLATFLLNPKVHYRVYNSPQLGQILSRIYPVQCLRSIFILHSHLWLGPARGPFPAPWLNETL
jgi:hypothetical protein